MPHISLEEASCFSPHLAPRVADIEPFHVMELLARSKALEADGHDIIHMEVGEPDFPCPPRIIEAGISALQQGAVKYTPALGIPELREAISRYYRDHYQAQVAPERIVITSGASGALLLALACLTRPGGEWLMADPGYPCNRHFVRAFEGVARGLPVGPDTAYQLNVNHLRTYAETQTHADICGVMLATPSNPTGTLIPEESLSSMLALCRERGWHTIVDEIYLGLHFQNTRPTSAAALRQDAFIVQSFSKYFQMTGWRLGWLVVPEAYIRPIEKLAQNFFISPSTPAQYAALAAFEPTTIDLLEHRRRILQARRDALAPALTGLGFQLPVLPGGAFYLYLDVSRFTDDSFRFARHLLEEEGVAITPGRDFGQHAAEQHVRIAYTQELSRLELAVERLDRFIRKIT